MIGEAYNFSHDTRAATCYEWYPNDSMTRIPEGCFVAIVRSHLIEQQHRQEFLKLTSAVGTRLRNSGDIQRLHFVIVILTGTKKQFINDIAPGGETADEKAFRAELKMHAHKAIIDKEFTAKKAQIEAIKLMSCFAAGRQLVNDRKITIQYEAHEQLISPEFQPICKPAIENPFAQVEKDQAAVYRQIEEIKCASEEAHLAQQEEYKQAKEPDMSDMLEAMGEGRLNLPDQENIYKS